MSAIVIFATKHGTTADVAARVAEGLGPDTALVNLADSTPNLTAYDTVVIGTPIYAGAPRKEVSRLCQSSVLPSKKLGLFCVGLVINDDERVKEIADAFPEHLREIAVAKEFMGGRVKLAELGTFERLIVKKAAKISQDTDTVSEEAIAEFVAALKE
ncbi:MAG: flavodoxin domain-containing protein [Cellulomonadaceae bacterium]|jgi:menaquinone-dependent protoporphyrinogen oxidase|nr:flavodoxin domain-containing protein [Cellulomonadaceae bacterium]